MPDIQNKIQDRTPVSAVMNPLASAEDTQFAALIRNRDPEALAAVVQDCLFPILRAARIACMDPPLAEEVTQATFVTFIETAERFQGRSTVRTWLFGILYRKIAEDRRAQQKTVQLDDIESLLEERFNSRGSWARPPRPVDLKIYDTEVRSALEHCLRAAPARQRMAFVLREVEGLTTLEICKILGVTKTNLGSLLCRVRNRLRECLEARGVRR